jgi:hypothetical protein
MISNGAPDPFGFTRMFLTWPIFLIDKLTADPILAEKSFVVYLWAVFIVLSFVFAELLTRLLAELSGSVLAGWRRETFVLFIVTLSFANLWSLEQLSDLYYTYIIEFLLVGISIVVVLLLRSSLKSAVLGGVALSFCILLDPNVYLFGLIAVGLTMILTTVRRKSFLASVRSAIARISVLISVSLPALLTVLFILQQTSGTTLRRPGSFAASSVNLSPDNAVRLLGYFWSLIVYAPPSILSDATRVSTISAIGSPPYLLLTSGFIAAVWLATTWFVPVFAFASSGLKLYRRAAIPSLIVTLLGLLLTQPSIFPFPYQLEGPLEPVPLVGGAYSTVFAIPDHILIMVALGYLILVAMGLHFLFTKLPHKIRFRSRGRADLEYSPYRASHKTKFARGLILTLIMFLLVFPAWQLFSGSFFPSSFTPGQSGNGIPSTGAFSSSKPPQNMLDLYNWLLAQPGNYSIYWPGPDGATYPWNQKSTPSIAWVDSPKPTYLTSSALPGMFPAPLIYLLASNLTNSVATYLAALNIKYLIAQPYSPTGLGYSWGVSDYGALMSELQNSPGLYIAKSDGDLTVFGVSDTWGSIYSPDMVLSHDATDPQYSVAYGVLSSLGTRVALTNSSQADGSLCINKLRCTVSILSPSYLSNNSSGEELQALMGANHNPTTYSLNQSAYSSLPAPENLWTVANWGPSAITVSIDDSMLWSFGGNSVVSLSYNGTVTNHNPGGITVPYGYQAVVRVTFSYRVSNTNLSLRVLIPLLNNQLVITSIPESEPFVSSQNWNSASFDMVLPSNTAMFTVRLQGTGSDGWLELKNVKIAVNHLKLDSGSPFGAVLPIRGTSPQALGTYSGFSYMQLRGNGNIIVRDENITITSPDKPTWITLTTIPGSFVSASGSLEIIDLIVSDRSLHVGQSSSSNEAGAYDSITTNSTANIVFARMFSPGYSLEDNGRSLTSTPTLDGMNLFLGVGTGVHRVVVASLTSMAVAYSMTLLLNAGMLVIIMRRRVSSLLTKVGLKSTPK